MIRVRGDREQVVTQARELQRKLDEMATTLDAFVHALQDEVARLHEPEEGTPDA